MGKAIPSEFGQWWDVLQGPSLEVGSPLKGETPLEVVPPLEVAACADLGQV